MAQGPGTLPPCGSFWFSAVVWPCPGCYSTLLKTEPANGRSLSLSLPHPPFLPLCNTAFQINKQINLYFHTCIHSISEKFPEFIKLFKKPELERGRKSLERSSGHDDHWGSERARAKICLSAKICFSNKIIFKRPWH